MKPEKDDPIKRQIKVRNKKSAEEVTQNLRVESKYLS
jgi:hypothetical protein